MHDNALLFNNITDERHNVMLKNRQNCVSSKRKGKADLKRGGEGEGGGGVESQAKRVN